MRKDPTEFRERFLRWKKGELVYENGLALPAYEDGKDVNNVPSYTPSIDDREQPGYRKYLWELSKARRNAFLKEYGDAAPIKNYYEDFLSNSEGTFNYRRWYNLASPAERKYGLEKGLAHWRDADGKTSLHPSFSIESPYSGYKNPYNPKGITGGKWIDDDHYEFSDSQINNDWPINKTLDEFDWSRKEEGSNTYGYYKGGVMLHEPTIIGKMPKYADGLTPLRKSEVNTNLATYNPEEDLYIGRYTLPEVTVTGDKNKVGTGMGKRLYMHPWKTVGDLSREQHLQIELDKATWGGEEGYAAHKDLSKPLSPVDPVGEFVVGGAVTAPLFKPLNPILKGAIRSVATSSNPVMQYVRYPIGKVLYGFDAQFPTVYRKIKSIPPKPKNGEVQISNPTPRFAFESSGEESPVITNFTYDAPVRKNSGGDWDGGLTLAMPGRKALLGKRVISTEPSDIFTYGNNIKMPTKDITLISGDLDELSTAKLYGYRTHTSKKLQQLQNEGIATEHFAKDDFSKYAKLMELETRELFRSPTKKDVDFMNFVLLPKIKGLVYDPSQLDYLIKSGVGPFGDKFGNAQYRNYLLDGDRWRNLLYDPATYAESDFRKQMGIVLKKRIPLNKRKWM